MLAVAAPATFTLTGARATNATSATESGSARL